MSKVSVVIPAGREKYLQRTIDDVLKNARGEIEVVAFSDGTWPDPPLRDDHRVILVQSSAQTGMRNAINSAVDVATGKYIMKLDAHCCVAEGFDEVLKADCEHDWLVVPRRYALEEETWTPGRQKPDQQYIAPPKERPADNPKYWDAGLGGKEWRQYKSDKEIDDLMSFQGSCYFMHRDYYIELGYLDESVWGTFIKEAQEIGVKVWLSGGRCVRNKKTWYAHWHKGKENHRGYYLSRREIHKGDQASIDMWMNNKWPKQTRDFKWLIDKFSPVPGWENFDWEKKCLTSQ